MPRTFFCIYPQENRKSEKCSENRAIEEKNSVCTQKKIGNQKNALKIGQLWRKIQYMPTMIIKI